MENSPTQKHAFSWNSESFLLDGQKIQLFSGEMHYQRIPPELWLQRIQMAKAMGLNCIAIYMFWNAHEPKPGVFDFVGINDVAQFVKIAQAERLWVIIRPGPYCCAEWDFGGLPPWLLKNGDIRVRCIDERYLEAINRYILRWSKELVPLQCTHGGPILMVAVENEYGSYGSDHTYLRYIKDMLQKVGFEVPLFTCDGGSTEMFKGGALPEILTGVNFGRHPEANFKVLSEFHKNIPHICCEYYPGWFNHWGDRKLVHTNTIRIKEIVAELEWMNTHNKSWNLYMFHGGTSWGFSPGANHHHGYMPDITSYDYSAPLDETGRPSESYFAIREMLKRYQPAQIVLSEIPKTEPLIKLPPITFTESAAVLENLPSPIISPQIHSMEWYGLNNGLILYRTKLLKQFSWRQLILNEIHDYAYIFLDGNRIASFDRRGKENGLFKMRIPRFEKEEAQLEILVESHGRINYGSYLLDRKGITEYVSINEPTVLMNWDVFPIDIDNKYLNTLKFHPETSASPAFHRAKFTLDQVGDTYLDCRGWKKGMVWVNNHNLGRFWEIGPQYTLFIPGVWLNKGQNELVLLDMEGPSQVKKINKIIKKEKIDISTLSLADKKLRPPLWGLDKNII